jgi:hypothetical protein
MILTINSDISVNTINPYVTWGLYLIPEGNGRAIEAGGVER